MIGSYDSAISIETRVRVGEHTIGVDQRIDLRQLLTARRPGDVVRRLFLEAAEMVIEKLEIGGQG